MKLAHLKTCDSSKRIYREKIKYNFLADKYRIINSKSFRRLEHKTQVFINYIGDHYRTRLTHSLEVTQIAIYIARRLSLNEDLAAVISLSHDIGHAPFGHNGEEALNEASKSFGGFDHNIQGIKIITTLEKHSNLYKGLNLTINTIDGILKHNGPINNKEYLVKLETILKGYPIKFHCHSSLESQISSLADDISYIKHDIDDGIRANILKIEDLYDLSIIKFLKISKLIKNSSKEAITKVILDRLNNYLIKDLVTQTKENIKNYKINKIGDIYNCKYFIVTFSSDVSKLFLQIKEFLTQNVYSNYKVNRINVKTKHIITNLFNYFMNNPKNVKRMPHSSEIINSDAHLAQYVINYISGMTDRFAIKEYKRLFDPYSY